jgi:hypothetical protein
LTLCVSGIASYIHAGNLAQAEETLNSKNPDNISISEMKRKLVALQQQVGEAQERLQVTQARVEENIEHINALRAEAVSVVPSAASRLPSLTGVGEALEYLFVNYLSCLLDLPTLLIRLLWNEPKLQQRGRKV